MFDLLKKPLESDLAYSWVTALFSTGADQPYGAAFAVFTSALVFIGALFMGWHIIVGITASAYSGKVLGERYHQIYAPLRVVMGFGLLMPIASAGGFSAVHYLLKDVVGVAAVQIGNAPITAYIAGMSHNPPGISPKAMHGKAVADQILSLQACAATVDGINRVVQPYVMTATATVMPTAESMTDGYRWRYGDCGTLTLKNPELKGAFAAGAADQMTAFAVARGQATQRLMSDLSGLIDHARFGEYFARKHFDPEKASSVAVRELQTATIISADLPRQIEQAADRWNVTVSNAAKAVFAGADVEMKANLVERIAKHGFMVAGSYERTLSQLSAMAVNISGDKPAAVLGSPGWRYDDAYKGGQAVIVAARQQASRTHGLSESAASPEDGGEALDYVMAALAPMLDVQAMDPGSADPVGDMIARGHWLVAGAQSGIVAMTGAHAIGEATGKSVIGLVGGGALSGAISYVGQWAGYAIIVAMLVGVLHAYVLPMIPMIMVFIMGVSWLVLFLEAAIAGVLWAFAFIRMDGQEFFDRHQAPGVTLLFNLFLRPAIAMLAFIGGLSLMPVLLNGLALIWDDAFAVQTEGFWINGLVGSIVGLVMFAWLQWHLYLRIWGLVPTIADRVGHWMGMQMHGYNDGSETTAAVGAMTTAGAAVAKAPIMPKGKEGKDGSSITNSAKDAAAREGEKTAQPPQGRAGK